MKQLITITSFLILAINLPGCKRKPFDYRNKYLGDYSLTYQYNYWQMDGTTGDTTIQYPGAIEYGDEGAIKIAWYDGSQYEFSISKKGALSKCNSTVGSISKKEFNLSFTDDLCGPGPLGSSYTVTLHGEKK